MSRKRGDLEIVGWREWAALPDLGIERIKVKIDTGARSSALHAYDVQPLDIDGEAWVRFLVHPIQRNAEITIECRAPLLGQRRVRSSTGKQTQRPVIVTRMRLGKESWPIEVTLVRRDVMGFRMLVGRQAVRDRYLVDAGRSFLQGRRKIRKKPKQSSTERDP